MGSLRKLTPSHLKTDGEVGWERGENPTPPWRMSQSGNETEWGGRGRSGSPWAGNGWIARPDPNCRSL